MRKSFVLFGLVGVIVLPGCASITGDTAQSLRIETRLADGTEIRGAECELSNEYGIFRVKTPGSVTVHRSAVDLNVACTKPGEEDAQAVAVSRANGGMWGNILFGGGVGAIIDHNKGTAYTYPNWLQLVFGRLLRFDRRDDQDGQPSVAVEMGQKAIQTGQPTAPEVLDESPVSAVPASKQPL